MNTTPIDIVDLIESNPIARFNQTYQSKLIEKLQTKFSDYHQQLFLSSFYCYLKYDKLNDFVIDLDDVWEWLGFINKGNAKINLKKNFVDDKDFKCLLLKLQKRTFESEFMNGNPKENEESLLLNIQEQTNSFEVIKKIEEDSTPSKRGGNNREKIMMNLTTFKKFCLKAGTKKADVIHDYFIKLEEALQEIVNEESNELRLQLEKNESEIVRINYQKNKDIEKVLISTFPVNTECIYIGKIDNKSANGENLLKFGHTNNLSVRVTEHRKNYDNFLIIYAFKVTNKVEIENCIKNNIKIRKQLRTISVNGYNKTENIAYDEDKFTIEKVIYYIKTIAEEKTYSIENFYHLVEKNEAFEKKNIELSDELEKTKIISQNQQIKIDELNKKIKTLTEKNNSLNLKNENLTIENTAIFDNSLLPADENTSTFTDFVDEMCIIGADLECGSVDIEGRFRIWNQKKPLKETFHALKNYFDYRFKPKRIQGGIHGYVGLKLKPIEYKKITDNSTVENFIFEDCFFSDSGKITEAMLLQEYNNWKTSQGLPFSEIDDVQAMKDYLKSNKNVVRALVWTKYGTSTGYYGLSLLRDENDDSPPKTSSTAKKVYKKNAETHEIIKTWNSIARAAEEENCCTAKMSRLVKLQQIVSNFYYQSGSSA
jgi:hypothetical protein